MAEKEYIEREAFLEEKRKLYCENCKRRYGLKKGKSVVCYEIGDAPCRSCGIGDVLDDVEDFPAADVRSVVRGQWEYTVIEGDPISESPTVVKGVCSVCHNYSEEMSKWIYDDGGRIRFNFCPNCGADMREES